MTAMLVHVGSWRQGYVLVGSVLLLMAILFYITRQRWTEPIQVMEGTGKPPIGMRVALREPLVWMQIVLFFLYVGLEFTVGQWGFTLLTESRSVRADVAGAIASGYFGAIGVGRILSGVIAQRVGLDRLIAWSLLAVVAGTVLFALGSPLEK